MAILPTDIRILFTNYDIISYFLNLASCSEHFISIKHRIVAIFNINKNNQFELVYAFNNNKLPDENPYSMKSGHLIAFDVPGGGMSKTVFV